MQETMPVETEADVPTPAEAIAAESAEQAQAETVEQAAITSVEAEESPSEQAEPTPWSQLTDPYDVLDLPAMREHLDRRDRGVEATLRQEFEGRLQQATDKWERTQAHSQLAGYYGNIIAKLEDLDASQVPGVERLMDRLETAVERYSEGYRKDLSNQGATEMSQQFYVALRDSLDRRGQDALVDFVRSNGNATWDALLKERDKLRVEADKRPLEEKVTKLEAQNEELKRRMGEGKGADLTPKTGGNLRISKEQLLAMTPDEYEAVPPEERRSIFAEG